MNFSDFFEYEDGYCVATIKLKGPNGSFYYADLFNTTIDPFDNIFTLDLDPDDRRIIYYV